MSEHKLKASWPPYAVQMLLCYDVQNFLKLFDLVLLIQRGVCMLHVQNMTRHNYIMVNIQQQHRPWAGFA